ncbi:hypothetical protein L6164_037535 [Bauhinia variegata]|uniref:Uncharacterized protein n=1 Tax=Bauhinia variegata TaxID=167791 RepID=A0ACB9KKA6_BAUVA|nr:hypothetical protein L6164_037535 [Bauhinia variegata]
MASVKAMNPEAPEFVPSQKPQAIYSHGFATPLFHRPDHYFFSTIPILEPNPLKTQTNLDYSPTSPLSPYFQETVFAHPTLQLASPHAPNEHYVMFLDVPSQTNPNPLRAHLELQKPEEEVGLAPKAGGEHKQRSFCKIMEGKGSKFQAYWRSKCKNVNGDYQRCGFLGFPKKKSHKPVIPVLCDENRTTVMIKNIPSKYTRELLLQFIKHYCMEENQREKELKGEEALVSAFDFLYLPIDFKSGLNKGYAFVNFNNPKAAWKFHLATKNQKWNMFQSNKIREVVGARLQGLESLKRHFENTNFPCECEEFLPLCFSPPRDGTNTGGQRTIGRLIKVERGIEEGSTNPESYRHA